MPTLLDASSGARLGDVSEKDLRLLVDTLEEESSADDDYFIDADTSEMLAEAGASGPLVELLRKAVGTSDGIDVRVAT
jgi:hypothetical protein